MDAAFYCMSSELYFLGAVGMINSLRLVGHGEPIYVLDLGMTPAHRALLDPHVTLVDSPGDEPPWLLKTVAPLRHPAQVRVLIDADMVVTRPLSPLIDEAASGRTIAVDDNIDRFVPEWGDVLELGPVRERPYVSSGLVVLGGAEGDEVLELVHERRDRIEFERSHFGARSEDDYPLLYLDQDVLNAVLASRPDPALVVTLDARLAPVQPFRGLRVQDEETLRCAYEDGTEPYVLHHYLRKPWLEPMYHGAYSRLLARLLLGDDVAIKVPRDEVPLRMRSGLRARIERRRVDATDLARWYVRDVIPEWIGERTGSRRRAPGSR